MQADLSGDSFCERPFAKDITSSVIYWSSS